MKTLAKFFITALLLYWVLHKTNWHDIEAHLALVNPSYLALAFFSSLSLFFIPALSQQRLFLASTLNIRAISIYRINIISIFYSLVVPGDVAAGLARFMKFSHTLKNKIETPPQFLKQKIISVMFADRLLQTVALSLLALLFLGFSQETITHRNQLTLCAAVISLLLLLVLFKGQHALRFFGFILNYLPSNFAKTISTRLAEIEGFHPKQLLLCLGLSLFYQLLIVILVDKMLLLGLNLAIPLFPFIGIALVIRFARMIPVTLSGIGVREGLYPYFLTAFGASHESAFLLGLLGSVLVIGSGLIGGLLEIMDSFNLKKTSSS